MLPLVFAPFSTETRALFVHRRNEEFRIIERSTSINNPLHITDVERFLYLGRDSIIPIYTISQGQRQEWTIEIGYDYGKSCNAYSFPTQGHALRFQQLLTSHDPVYHVEMVHCSMVFRRRWSVRNSKYAGLGAVQLWMPQEVANPQFPLPSAPNGSRATVTSSGQGSNFPGIHQRNPFNDRNVIVDLPRPQPQLVAFLRDAEGGGNTILKTNSKYNSTRLGPANRF